MTRIARGPLATAAVLAAAFSLAACTSAGSGAGSEESGGQSKSIKVWTEEDLPDRVAATQAIVDRFTAATGIAVELVPVSEDQFNQLLTTSAAADDLPDVIGGISLPQVRTLSANELLDTDAISAVVDNLGAGTFSERALELMCKRLKTRIAFGKRMRTADC